VDNDHGWNDTVVRVFGPWEAVSKSDLRLVPLSWNMEPIFQVVESGSEKVKARALKLYKIPYDYRNWSWLLNPSRLLESSLFRDLRPWTGMIWRPCLTPTERRLVGREAVMELEEDSPPD